MIDQEKLQSIIEKALASGADKADIIGFEGKSLSISSQNETIDKYHFADQSVVGIRVIKDQRVGISYAETFDTKAIDYMIQSAIKCSTFADRDPLQDISILRKENLIESEEKIFQKDGASLEEKEDLAINLEAAVKKKDHLVASVPYSGYVESEIHRSYLNFLGTFCYHRERSYFCYTSALLKDDHGKSSVFTGKSYSRTWKALDRDHCVNHSYENAKVLLNATSIPSGKYDIIFSPDTLYSLLACFLGFFSGKTVLEGKNPWVEKRGEQVASPLLTVQDIPAYPSGFLYTRFDSEGVKRKDLTLVQDGILMNFYHNTVTAKYLREETTGHGSRTAKSQLSVGSTHLIISPGKTSQETLVSGDYLQIMDLKGFHSGTNGITGHFSLAAQGVVCQDGVSQAWFKDVTISGDFQNLIMGIAGLGNILEANQSATFFAPKIRFSQVNVSG